MKILLTGATGFIGSNFARLALERGHEVAGLIRAGKTPPAELAGHSRMTWITGTLSDAPAKELAAFRPEVCVHAAWITTPGVYLESPENHRFLTDSLKFLRATREAGVKHIIGLGTCIEYKISGQPLSEDRTPIEPSTTYAKCKNELRLSLEAEAKAGGFLFSWGRVFYPYGPGEHPSRLCSSIIQKLAHNEKIVLKTPGSTKDYIYITDLAGALLTVLAKKFSGAINLGTGAGITVGEIARTLSKMMDKEGLVSDANPPETDPLGDVVADASRLRGLDWQPAYSLSQGLQQLLLHQAVK